MIHLLDRYTHRHQNHWSELVPDILSQHGYEVNIIRGDDVVGTDMLVGDTFYKASQYNHLYELLMFGNVSPKDIVIFSDAWNPNVINLRLLSEYKKLKLNIIGIWRGGVFDSNSQIWLSMWGKQKKWATSLERTLYHAYDANCFFDVDTAQRFGKKYGFGDDKMVVTGYPMIRDVIPVEKENIVILPYEAVTREQVDMFNSIKKQLPNFEFVNCVESKLSRDEYYEMVARAKVVLAINTFETDPTSVFEAMSYGCVPIVPDTGIYKTLLPGEYQYSSRYVQPPFLNFVRGRQVFFDLITDIMNRYEDLRVSLDTITNKVGAENFSHDRFLNVVRRFE